MNNEGSMEDEVKARVSSTWLKWKSCSGFMCDKKIKPHIKGRFYKAAIRPVALYGCETWPTSKNTEQKIATTEMRILRWSNGFTLLDKKKNEDVLEMVAVRKIRDKMEESRLRWFGHVRRAEADSVIRLAEAYECEGKRGRGKPKLRYKDTINTDMRTNKISETDAMDRIKWRQMIKRADPKPGNMPR
ncbi:unnamed protein product [Caenorhabditis angaria]|uniref:Uncharacterized protein n=1 Tax=Caenorhabditis angaria TaxID=860376 RepID=A0A9P1NAT3_9PELO|nr:unnamed protein product [Caenorhabditis angaria]